MDYKVELGGIFRQNDSYNYDPDYTYEDESVTSGTTAVLIPILYSIVFIIGIFGNILIMLFLAMKRESWSMSDTFILHLSLSDFLLLVTVPFWATQAALSHEWCCGVFLCRISGALFNVSFYSGMLLLVCITVVRYLSIIRSVQLFTQKTPRLAHVMCVVIWFASILQSISDWISLLYFEDVNQEGKNICTCIASMYKDKWHVVSRVFHHITFLLPAIALIVFFNFILRRQKGATECSEKMRSIKLILILVLAFILFWTPYNIALIVDTWRAQSKKSAHENTALLATSTLACVHACVRPLIYLALCRNFKEKTLALVRCRKVNCKVDLWELGVGTESTMPDQRHDPQELEHMTSIEQQTQLGQC